MHTLIVIGWTGIKTAYLDIPREEAIKRYMAWWGDRDRPDEDMIKEFKFDDEFGVYDAYPSSGA